MVLGFGSLPMKAFPEILRRDAAVVYRVGLKLPRAWKSDDESRAGSNPAPDRLFLCFPGMLRAFAELFFLVLYSCIPKRWSLRAAIGDTDLSSSYRFFSNASGGGYRFVRCCPADRMTSFNNSTTTRLQARS
jgi:hypothetical protein